MQPGIVFNVQQQSTTAGDIRGELELARQRAQKVSKRKRDSTENYKVQFDVTIESLDVEKEKELKQKQRQVRNRLSAQQARERRKKYLQDLQQQIEADEQLLRDLQGQIERLEKDNDTLRKLILNRC
eukprot:TRINITY_DN447_c0_g2_i2.p4 TRINITY_DN447_c0_g2~~TRINITY_DN447_c0_g2_i2.p4  ORF type:complete len:127 (+),score=17.23 TRINITY_DN447_c0_g2_i2:138-518(+)